MTLIMKLLRFLSLVALLTTAGASRPSNDPQRSGSSLTAQPFLRLHHDVELCSPRDDIEATRHALCVLRGGGWFIPAGWNPFGYKLTALGEEFLSFQGSSESDVGRFLASLKSERKTAKTIKAQWLEVLRVSKTGQAARIYGNLSELTLHCVKSGYID
jgi:hypothetical protein